LDDEWDAEIKKAYNANNYPAQYPSRKFHKTDRLLFEYVTLPGHSKPQLRTFIPEVQKHGMTLRETIITRTHNTLGHAQATTVLHKIRNNFTWPTLVKDVKEFCRSCDICQ